MILTLQRISHRLHPIGKQVLSSHTVPGRLTYKPWSPFFTITCTVTDRRSSQSATMSTTATTTSLDPIVDKLKQYTTCDVSNALVKLKHPAGGFLPGLTLWSPDRQAGDTRIVGPAYTVQYAAHSDPAPSVATHYIDGVPAGAVVFVSCPIPCPSNAVYGGLMTARARARGAVGTVVDGRFRDLQEQREMGYPVFARDVGTAPPQGVLRVVGVGVPVQLASDELHAEIRPGDYLIGDLNGVVLLPRELAGEVLPLMEKSVEADDRMMVEIRKGMGFEEASKKFRS